MCVNTLIHAPQKYVVDLKRLTGVAQPEALPVQMQLTVDGDTVPGVCTFCLCLRICTANVFCLVSFASFAWL